MKSLRQMLPYRLRRALLMSGIAGATFAACSKQPEPQHDTTYVWGTNTTEKVEVLAKKVAASADSAQVRYVILQNDGGSFFYAIDADFIKSKCIEPVIDATAPANRDKLRGRGDLYNVKDGAEDARAWLQKFGFNFKER